MLEIYFLSECGARTQEKERNVRVYLYNEYALPFPHVVHIRVFLFVMCLLYTVYTAGEFSVSPNLHYKTKKHMGTYKWYIRMYDSLAI